MASDGAAARAVAGLRQVRGRAAALDYARIDRAIALIEEQAAELTRLQNMPAWVYGAPRPEAGALGARLGAEAAKRSSSE